MPTRAFSMISGPDGHRMHMGDRLSTKDAVEVRDHIAVFAARDQADLILPLVSANLADYLSVDEGLRADLARRDTPPATRLELILHLNRTFSNFLSSIRTYRDHTKTRLVKVYGKRSGLVEHFDKAWSSAYREDFEFGFVWEFRNYVQHCGMPFDVFRSSMSTGEALNVDLGIGRDAVLSAYSNWGWLRPHIAELSSTINPIDLLPKALERIDDIDRGLREAERPELHRRGRRFIKLMSSGFAEGGYPAVADVGADGMPRGATNVTLVRLDTMIALGLVATQETPEGLRTVLLGEEPRGA